MGIKEIKLESGTRWEVRVQVNGKVHHLHRATKREAVALHAELRQQGKDMRAHKRLEAHRQTLGVPTVQSITLGELVERYVNSPEFELRPKASRQRDECAFRCLVDHLGEAFPVPQITVARLDSLRLKMALPYEPQAYERILPGDDKPRKFETDKKRVRRAPTINRLMDSVSSLLGKAVEWNCIAGNPCARLDDLPTDPKKERILTEAEEEHLLDAARHYGEGSRGPRPADPHDLAEWLIFCLDTGARPFAEVGAVRWGDIDWDRKRVSIPTRKRNRRRQRTATADQRILALRQRTLATLRQRWARLHPTDAAKVVTMDGTDACAAELVFGEDRQRGQRVKRLCKRIGLKGVSPYTCRHTLASRAVQGGVSLTQVQYQLGHQDPRMTQRYAHFSPEMSDAVVKALDERERAAKKPQAMVINAAAL